MLSRILSPRRLGSGLPQKVCWFRLTATPLEVAIETGHKLLALGRGHVGETELNRDAFYTKCAQASVRQCFDVQLKCLTVVGMMDMNSAALPVEVEYPECRGQNPEKLLAAVTHVPLKMLGNLPGESVGLLNHRLLQATWQARPLP